MSRLFLIASLVVLCLCLALVLSCDGEENKSKSSDENDDSLPLPSDQQKETLENGETINTAIYTGRVILPTGVDVEYSEIEVSTWFGEQTRPDKNGIFRIRMNTEANGLLTARINNRLFMLSVFPKHHDLIQVNPELSARSTGLSMVVLTPDFLIGDPRIDALFLEFLKDQPVIGDLTAAIEAEMVKNRNVMAAPSRPIFSSLAKVYGFILEAETKKVKENSSGCADPNFPIEDTNSSFFHDSDPMHDDLIYFRVSDGGSDAGKSFSSGTKGTADKTFDYDAANRLPRWAMGCFNRDCSLNESFTELFPPRKFEIPGLKDIILDIIAAYKEAIWRQVFGDHDDGFYTNLWEELTDRFVAHFECAYIEQREILLLDSNQSTLDVYTLGNDIIGEKNTIPLSLTLMTQGFLPILAVAFDVSDFADFDCFTGITTTELKLLLPHYENIKADYEKYMQALVDHNIEKAGNLAYIMIGTFARSPEFWRSMVKCLPVKFDEIIGLLDPFLMEVFESFNPFKWADLGIDVANLAVSVIFMTVVVTNNYDSLDQHTIVENEDDDDDDGDDDDDDD